MEIKKGMKILHQRWIGKEGEWWGGDQTVWECTGVFEEDGDYYGHSPYTDKYQIKQEGDDKVFMVYASDVYEGRAEYLTSLLERARAHIQFNDDDLWNAISGVIGDDKDGD